MIDFTRDGAWVRLDANGPEARLVADLAAQLDAMLAAREALPGGRGIPDDPALARLLPDAVRDDADAARELRELIEPGLLSRKRANLRVVTAGLAEPGPLDRAEETAWLQALTDLRLTIAARLGIEHEDDPGRAEGEGDTALRSVYDWLAGLQERLLSAIEEPGR